MSVDKDALIKQLGEALQLAWPEMRGLGFQDTLSIKAALFAYRNLIGDSTNLPRLHVADYNQWNDTIEIEGVRYSGELFREGFGGMIGKSFKLISRSSDGVVAISEIENEL